MEVPPTGMGTSGPERAVSNPAAALPAHLSPATAWTAPLTGDSVAALLAELSQSGLTRLLEILDLPRAGSDARVDELLRAAEQAAAAQNTGRALDLLRQLANLDPARAEATASNPALASIRTGWEELLGQLGAAARLHAGSRLAEATQRLEMAAVKETSPDEVKPEILLLVAARLMEAGGLANYVRSAAVSDASIDQCRWAPALHAESATVDRPSSGWRAHAPWLIAAWFALGTASAGLCWWLRDDYLPALTVLWAAGLVVLIVARAWRRPPRSY